MVLVKQQLDTFFFLFSSSSSLIIGLLFVFPAYENSKSRKNNMVLLYSKLIKALINLFEEKQIKIMHELGPVGARTLQSVSW